MVLAPHVRRGGGPCTGSGLKTDTEYCGRYTLRADGTLSQIYRAEGTVQSFVLTPLERLEDGVIVPAFLI